jgi:hypothetical protein
MNSTGSSCLYTLLEVSQSYTDQNLNNIRLFSNIVAGTIYVESTISDQDNDATIECISAVILMHMRSASNEIELSRECTQYDVFKDRGFPTVSKHTIPTYKFF